MKSFTPAEVDALLAEAKAGSCIYLVGAGGCGVSGLAHLLLDLGFAVAGSDVVENEEIRQLWLRGAEIQIGHDAGLLQGRRPILVVYSPAVRPDNPELMAAQEMSVPMIRRSVLLARSCASGPG